MAALRQSVWVFDGPANIQEGPSIPDEDMARLCWVVDIDKPKPVAAPVTPVHAYVITEEG